jgi:nicotinamidase-related amidase
MIREDLPGTELFPADELEVFRESGHGGRMGMGVRPVLMVVDTSTHFVGDKPEPVLDSIQRWKFSSGQAGWDAVDSISRLLDVARECRIPIVYTTGPPPGLTSIGPGRWADKSSDAMTLEQHKIGQQIVDPIAPHDGDLVILKEKPSAFFGTPLASYLADIGADCVVVAGGTTSGCVRATVLDAFSYNYKVTVVEEATFDRSDVSHRVSLFDMHQKYADVSPEEEVIAYFRELVSEIDD